MARARGRTKAQAEARAREKAWQQHREAIAAKFAARHPERAAEERALRKDRRAILKAYEGRDPMRDHGTPETRAKALRTQQGALARMFERGHLDQDELAWSQEIRAVAERIMRDVAIGSFSLETRIDCGRAIGGEFFEALGAVRAEIAYSRWRRDIDEPAIVLAMIVEDIGWRRAAAMFHIGPARAKRLLLQALQAWPWYASEARKEVSEADLLASHAGLL